MLIAVLSVSALIWLALGRREAGVVLIAIPVTLALTLFMFYLYGYTLNRITLFALIFSIGILVDDAIVVVENIVRHARMPASERGGLARSAIRAVDEVGNPTILATLAVIAAILPMAFVGGLMGPYMRPIPVGASAAMVFSLVVAFVVTPWAAVRLLKPVRASRSRRRGSPHAPLSPRDGAAHRQRRARGLPGGVAALLLAAVALVPLGLVTVKMLPFDNKSEFQVIIDMPEGTTLEATARVAGAGGAALDDETGRQRPDVRRARVALQLQRPGAPLLPAPRAARRRHPGEPRAEGRARGAEPRHRRTRARAAAADRERSARRIKVAEVPPGPPVLQTLVAEVYGPDPARRTAIAAQIKRSSSGRPAWSTSTGTSKRRSRSHARRRSREGRAAGISPAAVAAVVRMAGRANPRACCTTSGARGRADRAPPRPAPIAALEAVQSIRLRGTQAGGRRRARRAP